MKRSFYLKIKFKIRTLITPLLIIFLVGALVLGLCQTSLGQEAKPKPTTQVKNIPAKMEKKTVVFKGTGAKLPILKLEKDKKFKRPAPLTSMEKVDLLSQAMREYGVAEPASSSVRTFAKLDVRTPYVTDKSWMSFSHIAYTSPENNYVLFLGESGLYDVLVTIKPERPGQWLW